jgi:acetylornithine deacetylase/succinyl-diaminopimelate desuccinylase-like protein
MRSRPDTADVSQPEPAVGTGRHERPAELLQDLIRFETVNPPGDEEPCIEWIGDLLAAYGVEYETYASDPERPNLLARVPGGDADPLLLYGHVDVVPTTNQEWTHDPFEGAREDGFVWGRGALDMKAGVAMYLAAVCRLAASDDKPAGDVLFLVVSDEEAGGDEGLGFLVEEHPDLFEDAEYALGEFGGYEFEMGGVETYPIQVNEKQVCWLEATFRGNSGHASLPTEGTAMGKLAEFVGAVDGERLPVHVTTAAREMIESLAEAVDPERAEQYRALLDPEQTDDVLDDLAWLSKSERRTLDALLHNTANVTKVRGGDKENVVPEAVSAVLDCRLVPGQQPEDVMDELVDLAGVEPDFDIIRFDPGPPAADMGLFDHLAGILERETDGTVIPMLMTGATDGRHLAAVDVQSYGFIPMQLGDLPFLDLVHSGDERIPADTLAWGTDRVYEAITEYDGA